LRYALSLDLSENLGIVGRWRPIWPVGPRFGGGLTLAWIVDLGLTVGGCVARRRSRIPA